jgi:carboxymethylenebutenolidase
MAEHLSCPLLGLFGADDGYPSPEQNAVLEATLTEHGKACSFHTYEGAGHAFFNVDRPSYRPEAAAAGWGEIWSFLAEHLSA